MSIKSTAISLYYNVFTMPSICHYTDPQRLWWQSFCSYRYQTVDKFTIIPQKIQSVPTVTKDIFVWTMGPRCSVNYFNCATYKWSYFPTYLYSLFIFTNFHVRVTHPISPASTERDWLEFVSITTQHWLQFTTQLRLLTNTSTTNVGEITLYKIKSSSLQVGLKSSSFQVGQEMLNIKTMVTGCVMMKIEGTGWRDARRRPGGSHQGKYKTLRIHRIPTLATPLASNSLNSAKYCTLHYLNITYCWEQVYKVKVNDVDDLRQRIQSPDCMGWTWPAYNDKAIKQWRTCLGACVEAKGGHFEHKLWRL